MKTIRNLVGKEKGKIGLIIGAGASIRDHQTEIDNFIEKTKPVTIGINNMSAFWTPDYHLWTNNQRFRTFGVGVKTGSKLLLGSGISLKIIKEIIGNKKYTSIFYSDRKGLPIKFDDYMIYGYFRTAGCLAIMIMHLMGVKEINIVGMDGYALHKKSDILSNKKSQHCYGMGFTDTASWGACLTKDNDIHKILQNIQNYGIDFKILTPTVYRDFYDSTRLHT